MIKKIISFITLLTVLFTFVACSDKVLSITEKAMPSLDNNQTIGITLVTLENYTDTPRAGMRATNIVKGVLNAKGYIVVDNLSDLKNNNKKTKYYMRGAVSEWRYKTGIDGEPAVSIRLALYSTQTDKLVWSATGANNDWGNGSIGTTAQSLIEEMFTSSD